MLLEENVAHLRISLKKQTTTFKTTYCIPLLRLHFVSRNISLYHDTQEAIYRYIYTLYRCISNMYIT